MLTASERVLASKTVGRCENRQRNFAAVEGDKKIRRRKCAQAVTLVKPTRALSLVKLSYHRYGFAAGESGAGGFPCFRRSAAWPHRRPGCYFTAGIKRETNMRVISSAAAVVLLAGL